MTELASAAYVGRVVHNRLRPRKHAFAYRVFTLLLDVDEIDQIARQSRLFSRTRWNVFSFYDRDYAAGDGERVGDHVRRVLTEAGLGACGARVTLLSYPRIFGTVFNPLSVYFCHDANGRLGAVIYEVSNTFRERKAYVIPVADAAEGDRLEQRCAKELYVSPFTAAEGHYAFHIQPPSARVMVGVDLCDADGPLLKTYFAGERAPLTDGVLARLAVSHPMMTAKVVGGIHLEAFRLWLKGVPLVTRHVSPAYSFTVVTSHAGDASHA